MPIIDKFSVSKPKNWPKNLVQDGPKISFASSFVVKNSVQQAPKFGVDTFYMPHIGPSGRTPLPK